MWLRIGSSEMGWSNIQYLFLSNGHAITGTSREWKFEARWQGLNSPDVRGQEIQGRVNWSGCWWHIQTCLTSRTRQEDMTRCQAEYQASGIVSTNIIREGKHSFLSIAKNVQPKVGIWKENLQNHIWQPCLHTWSLSKTALQKLDFKNLS